MQLPPIVVRSSSSPFSIRLLWKVRPHRSRDHRLLPKTTLNRYPAAGTPPASGESSDHEHDPDEQDAEDGGEGVLLRPRGARGDGRVLDRGDVDVLGVVDG